MKGSYQKSAAPCFDMDPLLNAFVITLFCLFIHVREYPGVLVLRKKDKRNSAMLNI